MDALAYVDEPRYAALLLRRTYAQLDKPDSIMTRSKQWLMSTDARWNSTKHEWTFPSGATLTFGHLHHEDSIYNYQGPAFQFVGFDELTQFSLAQYLYVGFSRVRRLKGSIVPIRTRGASNPGGLGHEWVKERFITGCTGERMFIPSMLADNPYLDTREYMAALQELDPVTRAQLLKGDWDILPEGNLFKLAWFRYVDRTPRNIVEIFRHWDLAATSEDEAGDPDYTAGCLMARTDTGDYYILDVKRFRVSAMEVEDRVARTAAVDGPDVKITIEQEPGASGKTLIEHYKRRVLQGFQVDGVSPSGSKLRRSGPLSAATERGQVYLLRGPWNNTFVSELVVFPAEGQHDDQVDAASGAYNNLTAGARAGVYVGTTLDVRPVR